MSTRTLPTATVPFTIFIVDDQPANRYTLRELLDSDRYQLVEIAGGREALSRARELRPDLVLLDVMMPEMDGFEVTRRMRADPELAEVPIILVTALDDRKSRILGLECGADEFISKPFDAAELRARVRTVTRLNRYAQLWRERERLELADARIREQASLLEMVPDAIVLTDPAGVVQSWSRGGEQVFGIDAAQACGRPLAELLGRGGVGLLKAAFAQTLREGSWRGDLLVIRPDGTNVVAQSRWSLLRNADGSARGVLSVSTDVTVFKNLQAQFYRAQRLESLGALAGGVAHDLNNILSPILMGAELLRMEPPDPSAILATMETNARRGAALVRQILSFARGSDGNELVVLQPGHLLKDLLRMARQTFPKSIEITAQVSADLHCVRADPTQLYQALLNLMVNARDAMASGGRLTVSAENRLLDEIFLAQEPGARAGAWVSVQVADTGVGMSPETLARIWKPFFTTKAPGKGTGLGLSTVAQIVKSHGGMIRVDSQPGKGSVFSMFLPAAGASGADRDREAAEREELRVGQGQRILVVDDESALACIVETLLLEHEYKPTTAVGPGPAFGAYGQNGPFDLALVDYAMPGMDGIRLAEALHLLQPGLPIVLMTGSEDGKPAEDLTRRFVAVLTKPFTSRQLLDVLHEVLAGSGSRPAGQHPGSGDPTGAGKGLP